MRVEDETVWLTQKLISVLFDADDRTVNEHLGNIFQSGELGETFKGQTYAFDKNKKTNGENTKYPTRKFDPPKNLRVENNNYSY